MWRASTRTVAVLVLAAIAAHSQAPRIDSLTPSEGPITGGTAVVLRGASLATGRLSLDNVALTPSFTAADELRFVTPKHDNGYAILRISTAAGTAATTFLFLPPPLQGLSPGNITTVAGVGPYYGDYGPARQASMVPLEFAYGRDGSLYVPEPSHNRVVRVRPDGILEPFAGSGFQPTGEADGSGSQALEARIGFPRSVVLEGNGDVIIADGQQNRVWRVEAATGIARVIAGNGQPGFSGDGGPAVNAVLKSVSHLAGDGAGTIWLIDYGNVRIRRITPDGLITTICGTGTKGFSGDGGPASAAQFSLPSDDDGALAYDPAGFLYLADTGNQRVRRIDLRSGMIDTFIGPSRDFGANLFRVTAVYVGPDGDLYVGATHDLLRVTRDGQFRERFGVQTDVPTFDGTPLAQVYMGSVHGIAVDTQGNPVLSDGNLSRIIRLNRNTGFSETIAGIGPQCLGENGPALAAACVEQGAGALPDLVALPDGEILFSGERVRKIGLDGRLSVVAGTGYGTGVSPRENAPATAISLPALGLETDDRGNLYYATYHNVVQVDAQGILRRVAGSDGGECGLSGDGGPAREAQLCQPWDVFVDRDGNLFIADTNNNRIRRVDARTQIITTVAGSGPVNGFEGFFTRGSYCGDGGPATQACIDTPEGIAVSAEGEMYITEGHHRLRKVDRNGIITTVPVGLSLGNFSFMTFDGAGNLYLNLLSSIVRLTPEGALQTLAGSGPQGFSGDGGPALQAQLNSGAGGVAIDPQGNLYFTDGGNRRIRAVRYGAVLAPRGARAEIRGGTPQTAPLATAYSTLLSAAVFDGTGSPAGNVRVDFDAPATGPSCLLAHTFALTDRNGLASIPCTANTSPGAFVVTATPLGSNAKVSFLLTNTPPSLVSNSVANGASFGNGAVAPGEIVTVFGAGIGPAQLVRAAPGANGFGTELSGVRVRFNGTAAPLIHARFDQVTAIVPYALDGASSAQVSVEFVGNTSNTITVPVVQATPAIFSADSSGRGQGAILNQDTSFNSLSNPAARGSIIVLYATGAGQTDPPGVDGSLGALPYPKPKLPVSVTIGGLPAEVLYAGAAPGLVAGLLQVNARIPAGISPGNAVPVVLKVGDFASPPQVAVAVR